MIFYCPRCRLPLNAMVPPGQTLVVTCPACLELVSVEGARPVAVLPLEAPPPLDYRGPRGDVEAELQTDLRFAVWGILVFGLMALVGLFVMRNLMGMRALQEQWLWWIAIVTAVVAIVTFARHFWRRQKVRAGGYLRPKTTGQRIASVIVLGITGLLLVALSIVAAVVLLFAACLVMMR